MMRKCLLLTAYGRAFEKACQQFRDEAMTEATGIMEWPNKDFLEKTGHKQEPLKRPDGTYQVFYKKIRSDEEIQKKERETGEARKDS
jgi:hypothetical protein